MKVLFVSSGNSAMGISPIVRSQGESLIKKGIDLNYFTIKGKGAKNYLKNLPRLRKLLKISKYDLIHAHYSLSATVASLSSKTPMVVSLMGSDTHMNFFWKHTIKFFNQFRWNATIVKSERMKKSIFLDNVSVIPNGVDLDLFAPMHQEIAKKRVGFHDNKKHIIFVANPERPEKNYQLLKNSVAVLNDESIELNVVVNREHSIIPFYMNACDVLVVTSLYEGSPNTIKEAMACNCPIVATDVGDIRDVIGETDGCHICSYNPKDVAEKILQAIDFGKRTDGRQKIRHLDSKMIADKIIRIYIDALNN